MDKNKLKELLIEYKKSFLANRTDLVRREVQDSMEKFIKFKEVVMITGTRRGGKSSFLTIITEDEYIEKEIGNTKIKIIPLWKWLCIQHI